MIPEEQAWEESFRSFLLAGEGIVPEGAASESCLILSQIFNQSPIGIIVVGTDDSVLLINRVASQMLAYERTECPTVTWNELRRHRLMRGADEMVLTEKTDPIYMAIREKRRTTSTVMVKHPVTSVVQWVTVTAYPVFADAQKERVIAGVASIIDITDFKGMQDILYHQATHDALTGLSNKALLLASMGKAFARAKRGHMCGALLFLDVDKFKRVNDALGHSAGDTLLAKVAERICSEVRETDIVARVGGDEFVILLSDIEKEADLKVASEVAERICHSISRPFVIRGDEVYVTMSIGISIYPQDGLDEESILAKADAAMYQVKENGRNGWRFWGDSLQK